ncbi:hypothetical protein DL765_004183 [Monosporascus sp. GIB2]|nr:hypothetical protein DL765_004183 [Monosporascus sp. GIB2]
MGAANAQQDHPAAGAAGDDVRHPHGRPALPHRQPHGPDPRRHHRRRHDSRHAPVFCAGSRSSALAAALPGRRTTMARLGTTAGTVWAVVAGRSHIGRTPGAGGRGPAPAVMPNSRDGNAVPRTRFRKRGRARSILAVSVEMHVMSSLVNTLIGFVGDADLVDGARQRARLEPGPCPAGDSRRNSCTQSLWRTKPQTGLPRSEKLCPVHRRAVPSPRDHGPRRTQVLPFNTMDDVERPESDPLYFFNLDNGPREPW